MFQITGKLVVIILYLFSQRQGYALLVSCAFLLLSALWVVGGQKYFLDREDSVQV